MLINGLQKLTLLDYPGRTACTVFTGGCNFVCPFCHNPGLVLNVSEQPVIPEEEFFVFLDKRKKLLDGVCITGGEPTLQPDLIEFIKKIKDKGYAVKLDTNGYKPEILHKLMDLGLLDYAAMDIKSSQSKYAEAAGVKKLDIRPVIESADLLLKGSLPFEFRTTVVRQLHKPEDFTEIGQWLKGAPKYFIQNFKDSGDIIKQGLSPCSRQELEDMLSALRVYIPSAELRGED